MKLRPKIRLAIGTATTGLCRVEWVESLFELVKAFKTDKTLPLEDICFLYFCSSVIPKNRNEVVMMAKRWKATHILWIDDDMSFHPDIAKALIAAMLGMKQHDPENYPRILGANCIKRLYPLEYMAVGFNNREVLSYGSKGIDEVRFTGNAFLLTDMEVFDKLPKPWFAFPWLTDEEDIGTEDVYFMEKARQHGYGTFVVHELGEHINHTGAWTFKPSDRTSGRGRPDVSSGVRVGGNGVADLPVEGGRVPDGSAAVGA